MNKNKTGFTLIELLIVVAIIAILAAIAVPNFLDAQTRAKLSRSKADMKTLATAIEAYRVDNSKYPPYYPDGGANLDDPLHLKYLSTPVAYISDPLLKDPFKLDSDVGANGQLRRNYTFIAFVIKTPGNPPGWYGSINNKFTRSGSFPNVLGFDLKTAGAFPGPFAWVLVGYGPDRVLSFDNILASDPGYNENIPSDVYWPYDPTNGTVSYGDITAFGPGGQFP